MRFQVPPCRNHLVGLMRYLTLARLGQVVLVGECGHGLKVSLLQAKSSLSRLVESIEQGRERVIARNGRPAARLVPIEAVPLCRLG